MDTVSCRIAFAAVVGVGEEQCLPPCVLAKLQCINELTVMVVRLCRKLLKTVHHPTTIFIQFIVSERKKEIYLQ